MKTVLKKIQQDQSGAVTVDWVVLCAGVVALAVVLVAALQSGATSLASGIATFLSSWTF